MENNSAIINEYLIARIREIIFNEEESTYNKIEFLKFLLGQGDKS